MQPLGRKSVQIPNAKHKPKSNGKNIDGWWVDIASENKAGEKQQVKKEIQCEIAQEHQMITIDNLSTMIVYEKNCAVAEQEGYVIDHDHRNYNPKCNDAMWYEGKTYYSANYCNDPRDYMKLAIKYGITIAQDAEKQEVFCVAYRESLISGEDSFTSKIYPNEQTGEAVVDAFLLMEIE
tara:strand:+ start:63242 stop:63778 length:537 start_codon:yes stop_codon:yes gene_type:complete